MARQPIRSALSRPVAAWLALVALSSFIALPLHAQNQELEALEQQRQADQSRAAELERQTQRLDEEMGQLRRTLIEAARNVQDQEEELSSVEQTLEVLTEEEQSKTQDLFKRHEQLRRTLAALQRIALQPSEALMAAPGSPIDTVRSAMLLRVAVPEIEDRAKLLRNELDDLANLRERITEERNDLIALTRQLSVEREQLTALLERKRSIRAATTAEQRAAQRRAQKLAAKAESLRDLLTEVKRQELPASPPPQQLARVATPPPSFDGRLTSPIGGNRLYGFQPPGGNPPTSVTPSAPSRQASAPPIPETAGIAQPTRQLAVQPTPDVVALAKPAPVLTLPDRAAATAPPTAAPVTLSPSRQPSNIRQFPAHPASLVLPARGSVVSRFGDRDGEFAEGLVLATRPGAQVVAPFDGRVVYAGTFRGYGNILIIDHGGQYHSLLAGLERIDAVTGQWVLAGEPVAVMATRQDASPELYLELRHEGEPINPSPWLATTGDKVRG